MTETWLSEAKARWERVRDWPVLSRALRRLLRDDLGRLWARLEEQERSLAEQAARIEALESRATFYRGLVGVVLQDRVSDRRKRPRIPGVPEADDDRGGGEDR